MGTWGTGISSNDEYMEVYEDIMEQFNKGVSIKTALDNVIENYEIEFEDEEASLHNLYFAAAFAAWECGLQDEQLFNKVKEIIESGSDLKCWEELGADKPELKKREKALLSYLAKLANPKEKPKKPKLKKYKPALFEKGDVLSIRLDDGNYTGAVVLENLKEDDEFGSNFIVRALMNNIEKPTISEILNSKVCNYAWYLPIQYKKYIKCIEKIGSINIEFEYKSDGVGSTHSGWMIFVSSIENNYHIEGNQDIEKLEAFLNLRPSEIEKRQRDSIKRLLRRS